jgi:hypothetical protein
MLQLYPTDIPNSPRELSEPAAQAAQVQGPVLSPEKGGITRAKLKDNLQPLKKSLVTKPPYKSMAIDNAKFDFRKTIKVDTIALVAEIENNQKTNYSALIPDITSNNLPIQTNFNTLFSEACKQFASDIDADALNEIKGEGKIGGGKIARYAARARPEQKPQLLTVLNNFFGMLKALPKEKRYQALNAFLTLPKDDLNCVAGMVQRIEFIQTAVSSSNGLITHLYGEAEQKIVWGRSRAVEIHRAHARTRSVRNDLATGRAPHLKVQIQSDIEQFLEKDVRALINDLNKIVANAGDMSMTADAIKQCHEKHLPTLSWFFPPKMELTEAQSDEPPTQLHQHADYFELNEDGTGFESVKHDNILRDAIKAALPVLTTESKLSILKKNPDQWQVLGPLLFPEILSKHPNLQQAEFFNEIAPRELIPQMIEKGAPINDLLRHELIPIDSLYLRTEASPSVVDHLISRGSELGTFELLYLHAIKTGNHDQEKQMWETPSIKRIANSWTAMKAIDITKKHSINAYLEGLQARKLNFKTLEMDEFYGHRLGRILIEKMNQLPDQKRVDVIATLASKSMVNVMPFKASCYCAKALISTIKPSVTRTENKTHSQIVDYVDRIVKERGNPWPSDTTSLVVELMAKIGDMHAATLQSGLKGGLKGELLPNQNPQMKAYKLLKRQILAPTAKPENALAMIDALWKNGGLEKLDDHTRTISGRHVARAVFNTVRVALPTLWITFFIDRSGPKIKTGPLVSVRHAAIRLSALKLATLRLNTYSPAVEQNLSVQSKIAESWSKISSKLSESYQTVDTAAAPTNTPAPAKLTKKEQTILLGSYLQEFNPENFNAMEADDVNTMKLNVLGSIEKTHLYALLPELYQHSRMQYFEVVDYLLNDNTDSKSLTPELRRDIASKTQGITLEKLYKSYDVIVPVADRLGGKIRCEKTMTHIENIRSTLSGLSRNITS